MASHTPSTNGSTVLRSGVFDKIVTHDTLSSTKKHRRKQKNYVLYLLCKKINAIQYNRIFTRATLIKWLCFFFDKYIYFYMKQIWWRSIIQFTSMSNYLVSNELCVIKRVYCVCSVWAEIYDPVECQTMTFNFKYILICQTKVRVISFVSAW
jgi:hypothetical protein